MNNTNQTVIPDCDNIYTKCRLCIMDIPDGTHAITIFSKDFLDEKIKKYLYVDVCITFVMY